MHSDIIPETINLVALLNKHQFLLFFILYTEFEFSNDWL